MSLFVAVMNIRWALFLHFKAMPGLELPNRIPVSNHLFQEQPFHRQAEP